MDARFIAREVERLASGTVESLGCELIETEYQSEGGRWILRLYLDKEDGSGITLKDCERASRAVGALLDVENIIPGAYSLEISSPGLNRPVRRLKDFERFAGSVVNIRTNRRIGEKRNFKGIIKGVDGENVRLFENGEIVEIPLEEVFKARLQEVGYGKG